MLPRISDTGLTAAQFSNFALTTNAESQITAITETADTAPVYPPASSQTASYNSLNQLTNLPGQTLTYDANGNLLSDGQRSYAWDAERRLVRITYPGQAGKQSDFSYDGRDRRTAISETPTGGGTPVTTRYLWCGGDICQARNVDNTVIRSYHEDGEYLPGTPATPLFYGTDQVGSVRRVFTSTTVAPAFAYDPYGVPLQATAPATDFGYAGMFRHGPSGLNLTRYRAYDPVPGRWLSRDPLDEGTDPAGNLYAYVGGEPISNLDPTGEYGGLGGVLATLADTLRNLCEVGEVFDAIQAAMEASNAELAAWKERMLALGMAASSGRGGESAAAAKGRAAHNAFRDKIQGRGDGWRADPHLPGASGRMQIPDGIYTTRSGARMLVDLKPNTPSGRASGKAKAAQYLRELGIRTRIIYYNPR